MNGPELKRLMQTRDRLTRLHADDRFPLDDKGGKLRATIGAWIWLGGAEGRRGQDLRDRLMRAAGIGDPADGWTWTKWQMVLASDLPRYEPRNWKTSGWECVAPMARRDGPCGQRTASTTFKVTDPATGQWRMVTYCRRHADEGHAAHEAEFRRQKAGNLPEPAPNTGGLLAAHLSEHTARKMYDWAQPGWTVPTLGINADNWPVLERVEAAAPKPFTVIFGGREHVISPPPELSVVGGDL